MLRFQITSTSKIFVTNHCKLHFKTTNFSLKIKERKMMSMVSVQASWTEGYIPANGINIHYYRSSAPSPSNVLPILVFLHGLAISGAVTIPFFSYLADEFDIILPDARGSYKSKPVPRGSFTMDNLVSDSASVIRHFSPEGPVFLVGHSAGAATAARVAKEFPHLVRALILEDPPWFRTADEPLNPEDRSVKGLLPLIRSLKAMSDEEFVKHDERGADLTPPAISLFGAFREFDIDNCEETFQDTDDEVNIAVEGITVPTLLMRGEKETGSRCKAEVAAKILPGWSNAKEVVYEGAGHVLHLMRDRFLSDLRGFFKSIVVEKE